MTEQELLRAYVMLIKVGRGVGVREFQRLMGYRSPGKAQRMLEKLVKHGLAVRREDGNYYPMREASSKLGLLVLGKFIMPRKLALAASTATLGLVYMLLAPLDVFTRAVIALIILPHVYEALKTLREYKRLLALQS